MKTAELKEQFTNIIDTYLGQQGLWDIFPTDPYEDCIDGFVKDLIKVARHHKLELKKELKKCSFEDCTEVSSTKYYLSKRIKELRNDRKWSVEKLAKKTNLDANYLRGVERGELTPTIYTIKDLTQAFKIKSSDLLPF
jgi:DNA-binding XRE family transcriptional regulator